MSSPCSGDRGGQLWPEATLCEEEIWGQNLGLNWSTCHCELGSVTWKGK